MIEVAVVVRAALRAIGLSEAEPIEAALAAFPDPSAIQETRLRLIAAAKSANKTSDPAYRAALGAVDACLRKTPRFPTLADADFLRAQQRHASLKTAAEGAVARWEWWSGPRYELEPLFHQRRSASEGEAITEPTTPSARAGTHAFGFDEAGRLRVTRLHHDSAFSEIFFVHETERIERWHFGERSGEPLHLANLMLARGRVTEIHQAAVHGVAIDRYGYEAFGLAHIESQRWDDSLGYFAERLAVWNDAGGLERIDEVTCVGTFNRWRRPAKARSQGR
jgi:hypothetical protein